MRDRNSLPLASGLIVLPSVVFQNDVRILAVHALLLVSLQLVLRRRVLVLPNLVMLITITALNVIQPHGRILMNVFGMPVTLGALELGLRRSFVLIALIYLSRFMMAGSPRFPGRLGELVSLQFKFYEGFLQYGFKVKPNRLVSSLDDLLESLDASSSMEPPRQDLPWGLTGLSLFLPAVSWGMFVIGRLL